MHEFAVFIWASLQWVHALSREDLKDAISAWDGALEGQAPIVTKPCSFLLGRFDAILLLGISFVRCAIHSDQCIVYRSAIGAPGRGNLAERRHERRISGWPLYTLCSAPPNVRY